MFDRDRFIADCIDAAAADPALHALRETVARAVSDPAAILAALGEPTRAGIGLLHRSPTLTIFNLVWAPRMSVFPHNHNTPAVIGIYSGREDNIFWRRRPAADTRQIEAAGARSLCPGDVDILGRDIIHSVLNPIDRFTCAIHIYATDFVAAERSEWDGETLREAPFDTAEAARRFEAENARLR